MKKWLKGFFKSFRYAVNGIKDTLKRQRNLRFDFIAGAVVLALAIVLPLSTFEILWIVFSVFVVIVFEMLNSLIEELMDLLYPIFHEKVGRIKDLSAGIVLVTAVFALSVGLIILGKHLIKAPDIFGILAFLIFLIFFCSLFRKEGHDETRNTSNDM
ncbi:MAG TPA: diacylglycerol kinase family protein [Thermotogota bacterium]|nr:diacylglycerol kinase family protein [Thermotogota bacterium]HPJ90187.1 diacylglycerol kinase family protein [Thermotogota bacterium]HPR95557.1 diacylglycerol kinase family protein [Thermotogota bacterium]